jgi:hypothetical protein
VEEGRLARNCGLKRHWAALFSSRDVPAVHLALDSLEKPGQDSPGANLIKAVETFAE